MPIEGRLRAQVREQFPLCRGCSTSYRRWRSAIVRIAQSAHFGNLALLQSFFARRSRSLAVRGPFKPVKTKVPGIHLSELFPNLARMTDKFALVRSMHHSVNNAHALAVYTAMTGDDRGEANRAVGNSSSDYPSPGASDGRGRGSSSPAPRCMRGRAGAAAPPSWAAATRPVRRRCSSRPA